MLSRFNNSQKGILFAFIGFTAFAFADSCAKWLGQFYNTGYILFWTYLVALVFGISISPLLGGLKQTLRTKKLHYHFGRGVCTVVISFLAVTAMRDMPLSNLYTILFLAPFLTTILAWPMFNEPVSVKSWSIIALGFCGVLVAFRPDVTIVTPSMIFAFVALIFIAALGLFARPLDKKETLLSLSFYPAVTVILSLGILLFEDLNIPAPDHIAVLIANGIFVTIGLSGIAQGYRIAPFASVAPVHYSQMIVAVVVGYFVFGDVPSFWIMVGASIIILSGIALIFSARKQPKKLDQIPLNME
ncbi:MAG: EamA family transporter [Alphaproteobacteria bacterium]|nr:EamA family transporter [Alphaproteobacteria bacterium]